MHRPIHYHLMQARTADLQSRRHSFGEALRRVHRRTMTVLFLCVACVMALAASPTFTPPARAGQFPNLLDKPVQPIYSQYVIHNLFMDSNWDADNQGKSSNYPSISRANIDAFTSKAVASSYFNSIRQYGISSITFNGSDQAVGSCPAPRGPTFDLFAVSGWILCEKHALQVPGTRILWMVYVPMRLGFSMLGINSCVNYTGGSFAAYHYTTLPSIIPPDVPQVYGIAFAQCTPDLPSLTKAASHELIEAATDPNPGTGWINHDLGGFLGLNLDRLYTAGEAADICDLQGASPGVLGGYLFDAYWSNAAGTCVASTTFMATVPVPNVVGLSAADAVSAIRSAGLVPIEVSFADTTCNNIGYVINQSPQAGAPIAAGSPVTITVAVKPPNPCP